MDQQRSARWGRPFGVAVGVLMVVLALRLPTENTRDLQLPTPEEATLHEAVAGLIVFHSPAAAMASGRSCASCHRLEFGLGTNRPFEQLPLTHPPLNTSGSRHPDSPPGRNAPGLLNTARVYDRFFWDGGQRDLASQALVPLSAADEMANDDLSQLIPRLLEQSPLKRFLISTGRGDTLTMADLLHALAGQTRMLSATQSPFRRFLAGTDTLDEGALAGYRLYQQACIECHGGPGLTRGTYHALWPYAGPLNRSLPGTGRYRITGRAEDAGAFRTPTLHNVALTAPYHHNGRTQTWGQVHRGWRLPSGRVLSQEEIEALWAFMETLTDDRLRPLSRAEARGGG